MEKPSSPPKHSTETEASKEVTNDKSYPEEDPHPQTILPENEVPRNVPVETITRSVTPVGRGCILSCGPKRRFSRLRRSMQNSRRVRIRHLWFFREKGSDNSMFVPFGIRNQWILRRRASGQVYVTDRMIKGGQERICILPEEGCAYTIDAQVPVEYAVVIITIPWYSWFQWLQLRRHGLPPPPPIPHVSPSLDPLQTT